MPETTPNLGLQAPLGTEPVSQGDDLMRANNTILDTEVAGLQEPPSGRAKTVPDAFAIGTGWTEVTTLSWTGGGGTTPNGGALDVPAGVYLINITLNLQSLGADGYVMARAGTTAADKDLGGTAIAGGNAAHWHDITGMYVLDTAASLKLWLSTSTARNANFVRVDVVRLSTPVWSA
jgi:hypothetical protein